MAAAETIHDLVQRGGLYYKKFTNTPFDGVLNEGRSQGKIRAGKMEGKWEFYHDNGQLESIGNYENATREGEWVTRNSNGSLRYKENFKNGVREGQYEAYSEYGSLEEKGNFKKGKKEGNWTYYYENSKNTSAEENWKNGDRTSRIEYFENGKIQSKAFFRPSNTPFGHMHGPFIEYFENGTDIKQKGSYIDGGRDGNWEFFDAPSKKRFEPRIKEFYGRKLVMDEGSGVYKDGKKISD